MKTDTSPRQALAHAIQRVSRQLRAQMRAGLVSRPATSTSGTQCCIRQTLALCRLARALQARTQALKAARRARRQLMTEMAQLGKAAQWRLTTQLDAIIRRDRAARVTELRDAYAAMEADGRLHGHATGPCKPDLDGFRAGTTRRYVSR